MKRLLLALAACTPDVPAAPSFQRDVMPILAANCIRCHSYPAIGGAPTSFRLDAFDDVVLAPGDPAKVPVCGGDPTDPTIPALLCGAASYAPAISPKLHDPVKPMPPRFPLEDWQVATLDAWALNPERGSPHANNRPPSIELLGDQVRVSDPDGDVVSGSVRGADGTVTPLRSGTYALVIALPATASLDDGAARVTVELAP